MTNQQLMRLFKEQYNGLLYFAPGSAEDTARAFAALTDLPKNPVILDVGCGTGRQTLDLARLTDGKIIAVDDDQSFLDRLNLAAASAGLNKRISTACADMHNLPFADRSFDVIWAEGSVYIMGVKEALTRWKRLLKPHGYVVFTEIGFTSDRRPKEVSKFFADEGITLTDEREMYLSIAACGYNIIDSFDLPQQSWWNYYKPLENNLATFRAKYVDNKEAQEIADATQREIDLYRTFAGLYSYIFFISQLK